MTSAALPKSDTSSFFKPALYVILAIAYPLSRLSCQISLWTFQLIWPHRLIILATLAFVEAAFYLLWFLPKYKELNLDPEARRKVPQQKDSARAFQRFLKLSKSLPHGVDVDQYLSIWFRNTPFSDIKRGNVEEFLSYGFWYRTRCERVLCIIQPVEIY